MATTRPVVVITTAAPWLALFPAARDRAMAPLSAFWVSAWICALRLVTRSSPLTGEVWLAVPVTSPAALTETTWVPRPAAELAVVLGFQASLTHQVHAGEAGHRQVPAGDLLRGDRLQVAEHLSRVGPVRLRVVDHRLDLRGHPGELLLLLHHLQRHPGETFWSTGMGW